MLGMAAPHVGIALVSLSMKRPVAGFDPFTRYGIPAAMHFDAVAPEPPPGGILPTSMVSHPAVFMSKPAAGIAPWHAPSMEQLRLTKIGIASQSPVTPLPAAPVVPAAPDPAPPMVPATPDTGGGNFSGFSRVPGQPVTEASKAR